MSHPDVPEQSSRYTVPRNDAEVRPGPHITPPASREAAPVPDSIWERIELHEVLKANGTLAHHGGHDLLVRQSLDLERLESIYGPDGENLEAIAKLREQLGRPAHVSRVVAAALIDDFSDDELIREVLRRGYTVTRGDMRTATGEQFSVFGMRDIGEQEGTP